MTGHVSRLALVVLSCLIMLTAACSGDRAQQPATGPEAQSRLEGNISVSGAWALYPMMLKWAEQFQALNPGVRIDVSAGGAGKGATDALSGMVDIGMISRQIKQAEIDQGAFFVPVVKDAVFPTINAGNPALGLGLTDRGVPRQALVALFIEGKPMTWGEPAGVDLKDKVQVYTRSDSCGAAETWALYLGAKAQEDLKGVGVFGDPGLAEAVRKDKLGIGYNNLNFAYDPKTGEPLPGIRVLSIDINENGRIDPEEDLSTKDKAIAAVVNGVYPSPPARDLNIMTKGGFSGLSLEFVRWILTDGQAYVEEVGYIKLSDEQLRLALEKLGG